jgi:hypothetical protein
VQVERREEGENLQSTFFEYQPQVADIARVSAGARSLYPPAVSMVMKHRIVRAVAGGGANSALSWLLTSLLQSRIESGDAGGLDVVTRESALGSIAGKAAEFGDVLADGVCGIFVLMCLWDLPWQAFQARAEIGVVLCWPDRDIQGGWTFWIWVPPGPSREAVQVKVTESGDIMTKAAWGNELWGIGCPQDLPWEAMQVRSTQINLIVC